MSNPKLKNRYLCLTGRDAERTFDTERLLMELKVPYTLNNNETHLIAEFPAVNMHIWSTTMKWRTGDKSVIQGSRAALNNAIHAANALKIEEPPVKSLGQLHEVKYLWLTEGGIPPHQRKGFEGYKEELLDFYRKHQKALEERAHQIALSSFESMLKNKAEAFESLELHHTATISDTLTVTKVVGGWLYTTQVEATNGKYEEETRSVSVSTTFVPEITPLLM